MFWPQQEHDTCSFKSLLIIIVKLVFPYIFNLDIAVWTFLSQIHHQCMNTTHSTYSALPEMTFKACFPPHFQPWPSPTHISFLILHQLHICHTEVIDLVPIGHICHNNKIVIESTESKEFGHCNALGLVNRGIFWFVFKWHLSIKLLI